MPNVTDLLGIRDRAMLELFYSCGIRRTELCRLELADLNTERKTIHAGWAKEKKTAWCRSANAPSSGWNITCKPCARVCPWTRARKPYSSPATAAPFNPDVVSRMVAVWIKQVTGRVASLPPVAAHLRHAHAGKRGRHPVHPAVAGHEKLDTTAIYTEVSIKQLQEVHARCHPSAKLEKPLPPAAVKSVILAAWLQALKVASLF